ncbi:MAG: radical SAM protein [archaeon]
MVDVLLVNPPRMNKIPTPREIDCANPQKDFLVQPLYLAYLASSAISAGCTVKLFDLNLSDETYDSIIPSIKEEKPKLVIGGFAIPSIYLDLQLCSISKKYCSAPVGIWGPIPSSLRDVLYKKFPDLDFIIENEPEFVMIEIAKNIKRNKKDIFSGVKGVSYRKGKKIIFNGFRPLGNLDNLPIPAYDLLLMEKYHTPYNRRLPMTIMRTSRGCVARCIFCLIGGLDNPYKGYGTKWRSQGAKRTLKEIEYVVKNFGVKEINFFDAEFTIDKQRVKEICKEIIEKNLDIMWNCNARVDLADYETLTWMKKAGCYGVSYGVESINEEVLKICKKNINEHQVENAVIVTKKAGIQPALYFMIGLPGEKVESIKQTIAFAKKMALKYDLRPQCTIATPYPGTEFWNMAKKEGWIKEDFDKLEQTTASISYPSLSQKELEYWHKQFYKEIVLNPLRLIKRVLRIRHWNEIKSIPMHIKEFSVALFTKMRYVR